MSGGGKQAKSLVDAMKAVQKLHTTLMRHKDAGPFLEAVDWKAWNLPDYPLIIKQPMDLGLVQRKLDSKRYATPAEYARDVRLVWRNCQTYNKEDSEYHALAGKLAKYFDDKFSNIKWAAEEAKPTRAPTLAEKRGFSQNLYLVGSNTLGSVIATLDAQCPTCIRKLTGDDVEVNIDTIDAGTFWEVNDLVRSSVKRKDAPGAGSGGGGSRAGDGSKGKKKGGNGSRKRARKA